VNNTNLAQQLMRSPVIRALVTCLMLFAGVWLYRDSGALSGVDAAGIISLTGLVLVFREPRNTAKSGDGQF
jgi:hypothetical protein